MACRQRGHPDHAINLGAVDGAALFELIVQRNDSRLSAAYGISFA